VYDLVIELCYCWTVLHRGTSREHWQIFNRFSVLIIGSLSFSDNWFFVAHWACIIVLHLHIILCSCVVFVNKVSLNESTTLMCGVFTTLYVDWMWKSRTASVCPSVRPSQIGVLSKRLYESSWFWHGSFLPPVLHSLIRKCGYLHK